VFHDRILDQRTPGPWLDAGCGRRTFPDWRSRDEQALRAAGVRVVGCDTDVEALREYAPPGLVCAADLTSLPFGDETFRYVISSMVFEHLVAPGRAVEELARVTCRGGRILVHTVHSLHYLAFLARATPHRVHEWAVGKIEGRASVDVYPTCYRANSERRLARLFEDNGCRRTWGGAITDLPVHVPYPGLFWVVLVWGVLETRLARLPVLGQMLRPNLVMEFERVD